MLTALRKVPLPQGLVLPSVHRQLDAGGRFVPADPDALAATAAAVLSELDRTARALGALRGAGAGG